MSYHVEIKDSKGKVVRGIVAKTRQEALKVQGQLQGTPLVPPGGSVTIRADKPTAKPKAKTKTKSKTKRKAKTKSA